MKILQVKENDKKKQMLDLYFEQGDVVTVYDEDYYGMHLYEKEEFTSSDINKIVKVTNEKLGIMYAIKMITYRKRTKKEVENKLQEKGIDEESIENVIRKLEQDGYIDDYMYATKLIKKMKEQNKSKKQIEVEFTIKGLTDDKIRALLDEYNFDEVALKKLFEKRFKDKDLTDEKSRIKAYNFFRNKGFDYETISKYIKI